MEERNDCIYVKIYDEENNKIISKLLSELVQEMVATHMPISFEMEALKAQAIIARTFIVRKIKAFGGAGCEKHIHADLCSHGHCGEWMSKEQLREIWAKDFEGNWEKLRKAEEETRDRIITFKNKPIDPRFHAACGGATENSERVDENRTLYLRKVLCSYCKDSPYWHQSVEMSLEELEQGLQVGMSNSSPIIGPQIGDMIENIERDEAGRIVQMKIGGTLFKGTQIMNLLGLNSTRFGWKPIAFRIETQGKGDGLGLCQYGANTMAILGHGVEEILNYYFTGVQIKEFEKPSINKPLSGKIIVIDPGHGGNSSEDHVGPTGLREKDVNLQISLRLGELLRQAGAEVHETRTEDIYVSLSQRAKLANTIRPNFFLSIHQNAFANPNISGSEVYHYRGDRDGEALAGMILKELTAQLGTAERGVKTADFYLLREVKTTALQIEVAYITNPQEEEKLKADASIEAAANAIAKGLIQYYSFR